MGFAYLLQVISMAMSALLRSTERVRIPLFAAVASVATNMSLNWVFIYGKLGMPALGVRGAALATVCGAAVNAGDRRFGPRAGVSVSVPLHEAFPLERRVCQGVFCEVLSDSLQ